MLYKTIEEGNSAAIFDPNVIRIDQVPFGFLRLDAKGVITTINNKCEEFLGLLKRPIKGVLFKNVFDDLDLVTPSYKKKFLSCCEQAMDTGSCSFEIIFNKWVSRDKQEECALRVTVYKDMDSDGYLVNLYDITDTIFVSQKIEKEIEGYWERSIDGMVLIGTDGRIKRANQIVVEMLEGQSEYEVLGMHFTDYMDALEAKKISQTFLKVFKDKQPIRAYDWTARGPKTGRRYPIEISITPTIEKRNDREWVTDYHCVVRDITARKKLEEQLRLSEKRFREITENMSDVVFEIDVNNWKFEYISPSIASLVGILSKNAMEMNPFNLMDKDSMKKLQRTYKNYINSVKKNEITKDKPINLEIKMKDYKGNKFWVELNVRCLFEGNTPTTLVGSIRNIHDKKLLAAIIDLAEEAVYRYDRNGKILYANWAFLKIFDLEEDFLSPDEVIGLNIQDLFVYLVQPGSLRKKLDIEKIVRDLEYHLHTKPKHKRGREKYLITNAMLLDYNVEQPEYLVITRNITERKIGEQVRDTVISMNDMLNHTPQEIIQYAIQNTLAFTNSQMGFFAYVSKKETNKPATYNITTIQKNGKVAIMTYDLNPGHLHDLIRDLFAQPTLTRDDPLVKNVFNRLLPDHKKKTNSYFLPVIQDGTVVALAGIKGSSEAYLENKEGSHFKLLMNTLWSTIRTKFHVEQLKQIAEEKSRIAEQLFQAHGIDPLTQLFTRDRFKFLVTRDIARIIPKVNKGNKLRRNDHVLVKDRLRMVMADLNKFKVINDTLGHLVGDHVLKYVGAVLKKNTRFTSDTAGRYGGEEFILAVTDTNGVTDPSEIVIEKIIKAMTKIPIKNIPGVAPLLERQKKELKEILAKKSYKNDTQQEKDELKTRKIQARESLSRFPSLINEPIEMSFGVTLFNPNDTIWQGLKAEEIFSILIQQADSALYSAKAISRKQLEDDNKDKRKIRYIPPSKVVLSDNKR